MKMQYKKITALLLSAAMLTACLPGIAFGQQTDPVPLDIKAENQISDDSVQDGKTELPLTEEEDCGKPGGQAPAPAESPVPPEEPEAEPTQSAKPELESEPIRKVKPMHEQTEAEVYSADQIEIQHPMAGDLILTRDGNEDNFNGAGSQTGTLKLLTKFAKTEDINVDPKYIVSVQYHLTLDMCDAMFDPQTWHFYMTDGNWQEFQATYDSLGDAVTDTSRELLTEAAFLPLFDNTFDITDGYKTLIDKQDGDFGIRVDLEQYEAVFKNNSSTADNYLTYTIDRGAIWEDIENAADLDMLDSMILKNGAAVGINTGLYRAVADRSEMLAEIAGLEKVTAETVNEVIAAAADQVLTAPVIIPNDGNIYRYETAPQQNASAKLIRQSGQNMATESTTASRFVVAFDLGDTPAASAADVQFSILRAASGAEEGTIRNLTVSVADSAGENADPQDTPFYLDFEQAPVGLASQSKTENPYVEITGMIDPAADKLYVSLLGIDDSDRLSNQAVLAVRYNLTDIFAMIAKASVVETISLLTQYGSVLGLPEEDLTGDRLLKIALGVYGRTIDSTDTFLAMAENAANNMGKADILGALNQTAEEAAYGEVILAYSGLLEVQNTMIANLPMEYQKQAIAEIFRGGEDYHSVSELIAAVRKAAAKQYKLLLSGLDGIDYAATKAYLQECGEALGISAEDLSTNIDKLTMAYLIGRPITDILEFQAIYADYETYASNNIVGLLNRSQNVEEFDALLHQYQEALGLDLRVYDTFENKEGIYLSMRGAADNPADFAVRFAEELQKYLAQPQTTYAIEESWIKTDRDDPNYGNWNEEWMGRKDDASHLLKYDLSGIAIDPQKLVSATVTLSIPVRNETADVADTTFYLYTLRNDWKESTATYKLLEEQGFFAEQKIAGQAYEAMLHGGDKIVIDITDYIIEQAQQGQIGQLSFQFAAVNPNGGLIITRKGDSVTYAPMDLVFAEGVSSTVNYTPAGGSQNVPVDTQEILIQFPKAVDPVTMTDKAVTVQENGTAVSNWTLQSVNSTTYKIVFDSRLAYDTTYTVSLANSIQYAGDSGTYVMNALSFTTEKQPLVFGGMQVYSDGKQIQQLSERTSDTVTVSARVENNGEETQPAAITLALYAEENGVWQMIAAKAVSDVIDLDGYLLCETDFDIPDAPGITYSIACHVWDSYESMSSMYYARMQ